MTPSPILPYFLQERFLCKAVVSVHVSKPRGIALDPNAGLMFFSVWGSDTAKIERAQLVGNQN